MKRWWFAAALAAAVASLPAVSRPAAAEEADISVLVETCAGCHGPDLAGSGAIPTLRAHKPEYILFTLNAFASGERQATVMNRLAKGYSEAQIAALAAYLGTLD